MSTLYRPGLGNFVTRLYGTDKWVVAGRLTQRLRNKGYTVAITPKRYSALVRQFNGAP